MDTPLVLAGEFDAPTAAQWRKAVDKVLARKDGDLDAEELQRRFQKQLVASTYDGIDVQPLYGPGDVPEAAAHIGVPGMWPFVRGATPLGPTPAGWDVRQVVDLGLSPGVANEQALAHLEKGATSLLLRASAPIDVTTDLLDAALDGVHVDLATIALDPALGRGAAEALIGLWERRGIGGDQAGGVLGLDPIGVAASTGKPIGDIQPDVALARTAAEGWPQIQSWVVDTTRYHDAGASDTWELAAATATGVQYLRWLVDGGLDVEAALAQLEFRLAATSDQFATIAKLRAARRLWARVAEVLGVPQAGGQRQHAVTSQAMLTRYDPWVNLLRNTVAAFAAGVGGATAVTVEVHDLWSGDEPTELGRRMARNTQLLLIEESHLARIIDPGAGSSYIEWLTDALAERAWDAFGELEAAGGLAEPAAAALLRDRIERTWVERVGNVARRVDTVVGVSDFPNGEEVRKPGPDKAAEETGGALPKRRHAQAFEALRERADALEDRPTVLVLRLGPEAASSARSTYIGNFFASAGLKVERHALDPDAGADGLRAALDDVGARLVCLCSSDTMYPEEGPAALALVREVGVARCFAATSGRVGADLLEAGADELIHQGCDVLAALTRALDALEVP